MRQKDASKKVLCGLFAAASALAGSGCDDPDVYLPFQQFGGHTGVIDGTLTYSGPLPCTEKQHIVGAAALLAFDTRLLPPPEGLGTSAASLGVVGGDAIFAGVRDKLTFNADGARWCPPAPMPGDLPVTVSASWAISPLPPGTYQIRGFYDLDGDFDPGFSISNLPSKGDVGGGAIDNAAEVLAGGAPKYREITLTDAEAGSRVQGVAVTLGLSIPLERPVFYPKAVTDMYGTNKDPANVVMPSDFQMELFTALDLVGSEASFLTITLGAGVPNDEVDKAAAKPFNMPVVTPPAPPAVGNFFFFSRQDVNFDGKIDSVDHIPEGPIPSFMPLSIFSRLVDGSDLVSQSQPAVILQGLTLWKPLADTPTTISNPTFEPMPAEAVNTEIRVAIRPAALCLAVTDTTKPGLLVVTHKTDRAPEMHPILTSEKAVLSALSEQFKRPIEIAYGCIPQGRYAMNLVYPTGQAWTVPNEAAVCAPTETPSANGLLCGSRPRLASQGSVLTVGPPDDLSYCESAADAAKIREACGLIH